MLTLVKYLLTGNQPDVSASNWLKINKVVKFLNAFSASIVQCRSLCCSTMIDWSIKSAPAYHHFVECIPSSILIQSPTALFLYSYLLFFHFLLLLCEPRKWIKLPAVSHADRSLFFINKWASSLGRAAPSLYSGIYLYDRERGAEAITHRAFWWHSYEWLYSLFLCNKEREQKKKKEIRTVGSLFQIDSWGGRGRNPPRLWRGKGDPLRELQSSSPR